MNKIKKYREIDFGVFKTNLNFVVKAYKKDLIDEWFLDPLEFSDLINDKDIIIRYFRENIIKNCGIYIPKKRILFNVPKPKGTLRYSLETCFYDRLAFHTFGIEIIKNFDKLIDRRILNHRFDEASFKKSKHNRLFLPAIEQWKKYEEFIRIDSEEKTILQTDLQNYYENIQVSKLHEILLTCLKEVELSDVEKSRTRFCIDSLCRCLEYWTYDGYRGLPQNRDISSFLANIYLNKVDKFMISKGYDYFRYMDDITIITKEKSEAKFALKLLSIELRKINLTINSSKTKIIPPNTAESKSFFKSDLELEHIDALLNSKKRPIVVLGFDKVRKKLLNLQAEDKFREKAYRFCINRISRIARCEEIDLPSYFFDSITTSICKNLKNLPDVSLQFFSYLSSVNIQNEDLIVVRDYLINEKEAIYGWQNYILWKLFIIKGFNDFNLRRFAFNTLKNSTNEANIAGSLLYIGKYGSKVQKKYIINNFINWKTFFLQRHAIIALQMVKFKELKAKKINELIFEECHGMYKILNKLGENLFVKPLDKVLYSDLINEITYYV